MAKYKDAIAWIAENDDTEWTLDEDPIASVTALLVADIFEKDVATVTKDIKGANEHINWKRHQKGLPSKVTITPKPRTY